MYSDQVLDHFHHPRNVGEIGDATMVVETTNPACGDLMKLWAVAKDGVIVMPGSRWRGAFRPWPAGRG